jgi:hypothetical protein
VCPGRLASLGGTAEAAVPTWASESSSEELLLTELLFQGLDGFCLGGVFFSVGAGDVAERGFIQRRRAKFPQGLLAMGVAIGIRAKQAGLQCHAMLGSVLVMFGHLNGLGVVGQDGSVLAEGAGGTKKAKKADGEDRS